MVENRELSMGVSILIDIFSLSLERNGIEVKGTNSNSSTVSRDVCKKCNWA
jgi:hypothetical protein